MNDADCLKSALKEMGYEFEEHEIAQNLYGYEGRKREEKANIIIRRKNVGSAANDVGFVRQSNGSYEMVISEYDRSAGKQSVDFMNRLKQLYAVNKVKKKAKSMGYVIKTQKTDNDGRIKIKVMR
jgi:Ca2+-binding EF-hand superfamily protein